jgi:hypothetical protein
LGGGAVVFLAGHYALGMAATRCRANDQSPLAIPGDCRTFCRDGEKLGKFAAGLEKLEKKKKKKITEEEWPPLFDHEGRLKDDIKCSSDKYLRKGSTKICLKQNPFVFNVYPREVNHGRAPRTACAAGGRVSVASRQMMIVGNNKKLADPLRLITIESILHFTPTMVMDYSFGRVYCNTYCVFNPSIGYLLRINDLCMPIISPYFLKWDTDTSKHLNQANISFGT